MYYILFQFWMTILGFRSLFRIIVLWIVIANLGFDIMALNNILFNLLKCLINGIKWNQETFWFVFLTLYPLSVSTALLDDSTPANFISK